MEIAAHIWLVGKGALFDRIATGLRADGNVVGRASVPTPETALMLVNCAKPNAASGQTADECFAASRQCAPNARCVALLTEANSAAVVAAFSSGADDYISVDPDPEQAVTAVVLHVRMTLSRLRREQSQRKAQLPLMADPVVARPAHPDLPALNRDGSTTLSCVVSTRGRLLRWCPSVAPFVAAKPVGTSFFELLHPDDRPTVRNAALLLMAGEAAVDIDARMAPLTETNASADSQTSPHVAVASKIPVRWRLVMHSAQDRFLAVGSIATKDG